MTFRMIFITVCLSVFISSGTCTSGLDPHFWPEVNTTEVFYLKFSQYVFTDGPFLDNRTNLKYRVSLADKPDLPNWIYYVHEPKGEAYLYGSPPIFSNMDKDYVRNRKAKVETVRIQIIATSKINYQVEKGKIHLKIKEKEREKKAKFEVELRFSNWNVEDMFEDNRINHLLKIIATNLWKIDEKWMYLTFLASAVKMGGRLPAHPMDKDGIVVRVGSPFNFSSELLDLEQEVIPLRVHVPCPREFRRTSADRYFRIHGFIPEWCSFKLHYTSSVIQEDSNGPMHSPIHLTSDAFNPPAYIDEPHDLVLDFTFSVIIPIVTSILLLVVVAFFLCCYHEGIEKRNKSSPSIQMVQYASIHRASNNLRSLAMKRDGSKPTGISPASTLQRSYPSSPSNTMSKQTQLTKDDDGKEIANCVFQKEASIGNHTTPEKTDN